MDELLWKIKLAAWTHDPPEKALILMATAEGHERGTVVKLRERLGVEEVARRFSSVLQRADHWASAADRPQFPHDASNVYAAWSQVRFSGQALLKHPLTTEEFKIQLPPELDAATAKRWAQAGLADLLRHEDLDAKRTALLLWRFAPVQKYGTLGRLARHLPADTRNPDHSIWQHLDLVSAFASAMYTGSEATGSPALLTMSFGPVQEFIAQARSTNDLWAGSHLLSRIAWAGMEVICEELGPENILFPSLRGVPVCDLWLRQQGLPAERFDFREIARSAYAAALPNKFVALVPESKAASLAERVREAVRRFVADLAPHAIETLLGADMVENPSMRQQVRDQLAEFPEVHFAIVPWSLAADGGKGKAPDTTDLAREAQDLFGGCPFLEGKIWAALKGEVSIKGHSFYRPNQGVLYPAFYDLAERTLAASKTVRPFRALAQQGYRCSLCAEREWLAEDARLLRRHPSKDDESRWARRRGRRNERLCALCALKRAWPQIFSAWLGERTGQGSFRAIVSTHTMALGSTLSHLGRALEGNNALLKRLQEYTKECDPVLVSGRVLRGWSHLNDEQQATLRRVPDALDHAGEREYRRIEADLKNLANVRVEGYYALLLMDGDRMGEWLSGSRHMPPLKQSWHPQLTSHLEEILSDTGDLSLRQFMNLPRPVSPARHAAISGALNSFSSRLVRAIVEETFRGLLIYSGGDDVLAMVPVQDLLPCLLLLRCAYSGTMPSWAREILELHAEFGRGGWRIKSGFVEYRDELFQVMGEYATASAGAVIAQHKAPLSMVLRELRAAESEAKRSGRDSLTIRLLKRAGGATHLTIPWELGDPNAALRPIVALSSAFAGKLSRRAAYHIQEWLNQIPPRLKMDDGWRDMVARNLAWQFDRQGSVESWVPPELAAAADRVPLRATPTGATDARRWLIDLLTVAEFLGREVRAERPGKEMEEADVATLAH